LGYDQLAVLKYDNTIELYSYKLDDTIGLATTISTNINITKISCRGPHLLLLSSDHQLYGKGANDCRELDDDLSSFISTIIKIKTQEPIINSMSDALYNICYLCGTNLYVNGMIAKNKSISNVQQYSISSTKIAYIDLDDNLFDENTLLAKSVKKVECGCTYIAGLSDRLRLFGQYDDYVNDVLVNFKIDSIAGAEYHLDFCSGGFLYRVCWDPSCPDRIKKLTSINSNNIYSGGNYGFPVSGIIDFG